MRTFLSDRDMLPGVMVVTIMFALLVLVLMLFSGCAKPTEYVSAHAAECQQTDVRARYNCRIEHALERNAAAEQACAIAPEEAQKACYDRANDAFRRESITANREAGR